MERTERPTSEQTDALGAGGAEAAPPNTDLPGDGREAGIVRRRPRTEGETAAMPAVQVGLALLVIFLFLLVLWIVWPVVTGA